MRSYFRKDYDPKFKSFSCPVNAFEGFDAFSGENWLPFGAGVYAYNVCAENGILREGAGVENAEINGRPFPDFSTLGSKIINAAVYRRYDREERAQDDMLVFLTENKKIYYMRFADMHCVDTGIVCSTKNVTFLNFHANDKDLFLIMTDKSMSYRFDGSDFIRFEAPASVSACVHGTRVFSVNGNSNQLFFSESLDPTVWIADPDYGGNIRFPDEGGALIGVVSWKNYIYIFREFAVYRMSAYVDQRDFSVVKVFETSARINFDTVAVCNDKMVFLTDEGFYSFDGYSIKPVLYTLFPFIKNCRTAHAVYYGARYYVSAEIKKDGETVGDEGDGDLTRNGVISYDFVYRYNGIFRGADIKKFLPVGVGGESKLLLFFGGERRKYSVGTFTESGKLFDTPLKKLWRSPTTDLGILNQIKVLKKMYIRTGYDITLNIKLDKSYPVRLIGGREVKMIPVNRSAEKVGFEIRTEEDKMDIRSVLLEFNFIRRLPNE